MGTPGSGDREERACVGRLRACQRPPQHPGQCLKEAASLRHLCTALRSCGRGEGMGGKGAALTERGQMRSHMEEESRLEGMSQSSEFYNWKDIPSTEAHNMGAWRKSGHGTMEGEETQVQKCKILGPTWTLDAVVITRGPGNSSSSRNSRPSRPNL